MITKILPIETEKQWCIKEENYSADTSKYYEGLFTQGNGYMHVRGSFEEGIADAPQDEEYLRMPANVTLEKARNPKSKWGTYIPGIVGAHPYLKTEIINLPYFLDFELSVPGEKMDMEHSRITNYCRWLNLKDGCIHRNFQWETKTGLHLKLEYIRFISMADRHIGVQQIQIQVLSGQGEVTFKSGINTGVRTNGFNHFKEVRPIVADASYIGIETMTNGENHVLMMSGLEMSEDMELIQKTEPDRVMFEAGKEVKAGDTLTIIKTTAICTDRDMEDGSLEKRAGKYLDEAGREGAQQLYDRHVHEWAKKWKASDIKLIGDDRAQLALRASIYHLIRANNDKDDRVAICAKGYAGEAYFGRYFWDTEINMLPFFIHTNPQAAEKLLKFRYLTLDGARRNAKAYGYKGARYAWESAITGDEECPNWQYGDHEIHITADIIYAMFHYAKATNDFEFIRKYGIEMLVETARYWVGRVDWNKKGYYELLGVMGPDEYLPMTRNNAYTNRMVKFSLEKTMECLEALQKSNEELYTEITHKLELSSDEIEKIREVKDKLKISYDENTDIILQSDDFEDYADIDFDELWKDRTKCFGAFISQEKNYRSKALKQADVLEMMMLYPNEFTQKQLSANYDYYEPITTHDSSLSAAVHGILAAWMGRMDEAEKFLEKVINIDMDVCKKGAEEGIHIANCGGLWQMIVYGFAGLKSAMWNDEMKLEPHLPTGWSKLEIPIQWHGKQYRITVTQDNYEICEMKDE